MTEPNPTEIPNAGVQAAEQAAEYNNLLFASLTLRFDDGTSMSIPPQPSLRMLDDDCLAAYDELHFEAESYDRGPDVIIPEHQALDKDGKPTGATIPEEIVKGNLLVPYRKEGKLVSPPFDVREVMAVLGEEKYRELRSKTIDGRPACAADVRRLWGEQGLKLMERQKSDSKSPEGPSVLASLAAPDSQ
ncbi:hypothetical protein MMRN_38400 [Mycobacterium marinum]|uniref:hypothetical protein n=1 Tax=Mycobacterium marinum TaxID=1781 RepID=UPI000CD84F10|nr:hypothetical protein [Mycobacterium marinum]AXN50935.1 hypothetical protein CCUG20998_03533 [Mycobacterium marinum]RFZ25467.1 hypothetical protein DSM43519_01653 [Mycobacterium marinum]RFZ28354.1 hypothetical protein DSM44344_01399 [Mycobacterium marinum]RFZ33819.1 hypothetical protein NCTC2275_02665 [Mycobacterium marinum]WOR02986.1 hypothetical protein QDR78_17390 [Mycobacterium marinum]